MARENRNKSASLFGIFTFLLFIVCITIYRQDVDTQRRQYTRSSLSVLSYDVVARECGDAVCQVGNLTVGFQQGARNGTCYLVACSVQGTGQTAWNETVACITSRFRGPFEGYVAGNTNNTCVLELDDLSRTLTIAMVLLVISIVSCCFGSR